MQLRIRKVELGGSLHLPEILTQGCIPQVDLPQKISALHHQRFESYAQFSKNVFYRPVIYWPELKILITQPIFIRLIWNFTHRYILTLSFSFYPKKFFQVVRKSAILILKFCKKFLPDNFGHFHLETGKNCPFSAFLSGKKGRFLTKSQGKLLWGTAGNPALCIVFESLNFKLGVIFSF